ncbi:MAG: hypothetical protein NXI24_10795 [bacterium]|nr:hypothetical protein [bacterium]
MSNFEEIIPVLMTLLLPAFFFSVVTYIVYRLVKYGGVRGSILGSVVDKTVGQVDGKASRWASSKMSVHILQSKDIGIDITSKTFGSWQMHPLTLEKGEVQKLIQILQRALEESR